MRWLAASAVIALLLQLFLVPSRHSEEQLHGLLVSELAAAEGILGSAAASQSWERADAWHRALIDGIALFDIDAAATRSERGRVTESVRALSDRVRGNAYFRAMRVLLHLWCLRLALLAHCWTCLALPAAAALLDGWTTRRLRRVLVRPDRPERFASAGLAWLGSLWATVALAGAPWVMSLPGLLMVLSMAALLAGQMLAWHHGGST